MDFDYSVTTEDRFALRKWLEQLVEAINYNDRGAYSPMLGDGLIVEGFSDQAMDRAAYVTFLEQRSTQPAARIMRFPDLNIKFHHYLYHLRGTYEEFIDGILSYEGSIDMTLAKQEDNFVLLTVKFYPRLRLA